ncbi:hypothetical protein DYI37_14935 [Fulvimarina endophytica]|uniref:Uncharacterized protein n=1 Tax=Fulvimarina endophytica TaxID=2293836 RepID=A0A371X007_9HYPH|nr:hypothetical protein [Fulvimarina endophytica]RFC62545.1 hypothetical protein DYI37_14935 [Fulvimarina endophytica]
MIPLAQYLNDRDGDASFQSFAPASARPQRRGGDKPEFRSIGERPASRAPAEEFETLKKKQDRSPSFKAPETQDGAFEVDTDALFAEMENELIQRAAPSAPTRDARALQSELREKTERANPAEALEKARREAYDQGRAEAAAEAEAVLEAAVEAAREEEREAAAARQAEAIEAARAEWALSEGQEIGKRLTEQTERLAGAMRMTYSSVLRPIAINARQRQSIDDLVTAIAVAAFDGQAMSVRATGSADLLEGLELALGAQASHVTFEPVEGEADARIEIGQTVLQSRLGEWRAALETALS